MLNFYFIPSRLYRGFMNYKNQIKILPKISNIKNFKERVEVK